jgi:hypothetical protein
LYRAAWPKRQRLYLSTRGVWFEYWPTLTDFFGGFPHIEYNIALNYARAVDLHIISSSLFSVVQSFILNGLLLITVYNIYTYEQCKYVSFFTLGPRWGWLVDATSQPLYLRERDLVPILQDAGCALGPVWAGADNLSPTGIRSPDRPALASRKQPMGIRRIRK